MDVPGTVTDYTAHAYSIQTKCFAGSCPCRLRLNLVRSKYPNALRYYKLRLRYDTCFTLHFLALLPILSISGSRLGRGERAMDWKQLLGSLSESVDEELR